MLLKEISLIKKPLEGFATEDIQVMVKQELDFSFRENIGFDGYYSKISSISTATVLNGYSPRDFVSYRVQEIVRVNPWLSGRLHRNKDKLFVEYYNDPSEFQRCFNFISTEAPSQVNDYEFYNPYLVLPAGECVGQEHPLFCVTILSFPNNSYTLLFSLSHLLGDGHTFYTLYGMLDPGSIPYALNPQRDKHLQDKVTALAMESEIFWASLPANLLTPVTAQCRCSYLSEAWINNEKQRYAEALEQGDPPFVSSNDIITAEFFKATKTDVGMMATNFRNRVDGITSELAGNYGCGNAFLPEDFADARSIRRSVPLMKRAMSKTPLTKELWEKENIRLGFITNWVNPYKHVEFPNCEQVLHLPLYEEMKSFFNVGIVFMANQGKPAIMTFEANINTMDELGKIGLVEGNVF